MWQILQSLSYQSKLQRPQIGFFSFAVQPALVPSPAVKKKLESISWSIFFSCCSTVFNFVKLGQLNRLKNLTKLKTVEHQKKSAFRKWTLCKKENSWFGILSHSSFGQVLFQFLLWKKSFSRPGGTYIWGRVVIYLNKGRATGCVEFVNKAGRTEFICFFKFLIIWGHFFWRFSLKNWLVLFQIWKQHFLRLFAKKTQSLM